MATPVDLEVRPEAGGSVIPIPLSSTGSDGKAKIWAVRDEKGRSLISADTQVPVVKLGATLQLQVVASDSTRDALITAPAQGMCVYNQTFTSLQVYDGTNWVTLATA